MSSVDYENQILNAIGTIVNNAVENAGYDKTIKAIIEKCIDATLGCYQVHYQDSVFEAYAADIEVSYSKGTLVQVLIPGNDMTQNKTILGAIQRNEADYGTLIDPESAYEVIGTNVIAADTSYGLCSYLQNDVEILYSRDAGINLINLDETSFANNVKDTNTIICGAEFKTELASEQAARGNFGIAFDIDFKDNISGDIVTKTYIVDVNNMLGNPYNQRDFTRQKGIFSINGENYDSINQIYIFSEEFPTQAVGKPDDIFAQNFELTCATRLTDEEINNYSLKVVTSGKNYFTSGDSGNDTIILLANFKIKGVAATSNTPGIEYYWFKENASITKRSLNYCSYGGEGWECLNGYNIVNIGSDTKVWINGNSSYTVQKDDITAGKAKYKCVVVYNAVVTLEDSVELLNYDTLYNLEIYSDQGTQFYYDIGNPTLTLLVNGSSNLDPSITCQWGVVDNNGQYTILPETTTENLEYNDTKADYDDLVARIASGAAMPAASKDELESYKAILDNYETIRRVEGNVVHKVQIRDINDYAIYRCSIYKDDIFVGTTTITLVNNLNIEGMYNLEIVNGDQVFNYNAMGTSPANEALEDPIEILPLSFKIYDNLGNELGDMVYRHCEVQWTIPKENTMLVGNDATNVLNYNFGIADIYDSFKSNNNIELNVKYKDLNIKGQTTLSFLKDGDPGTNGTDIVCKIVPNTTETMTTYPMLINGTPNFTPAATGKWFKVQLWKNGKLIFDRVNNGNSTEGIAATVKWSVHKNTYTTSVADPSAINCNASTGNFSYNSFQEDGANIIKCSVTYDGKYYYSMLPLITQSVTDNTCTIKLERNTGYRYVMYSSGGKEPQYDNTYPFTLKIMKTIDGYDEDISDTPNTTYKLNYTWTPKGRVYKSSGWVNTNDLIAVTGEITNSNKRNFKPADTFDGECLTEALLITIKDVSNNEVAKVHIPIHFYLNKYGIAALNDWDGNNIHLNDELGSILAPQVGAGSKDANNRFTGILMGKVKESNLAEKEGLFGFYQGERTIFLDAHTGKAEFGKTGAGQIILDPTNNTAKIQSGNYVAGTSGLLIDFTTPEIKFGSGNFSVNSSGHLTAKGGGSIGGWSIGNTTLTGGNITLNSNGSISGGSTYTWSIGTDGYATFNGIKGNNATITGNITANTLTANTAGTIGGFTIRNGYLISGEGTNAEIGMSTREGTDYAFWAGGSSTTAPFRAGHHGDVICDNITINGGSVKGSVVSSGINAGNITAGTLNIHNSDNSCYLKMGFGTSHPEVSGLNVTGGNGIALNNHGISGCNYIGNDSGALTLSCKSGSDISLNAGGKLYLNGIGTSAKNIIVCTTTQGTFNLVKFVQAIIDGTIS